MKKTADETLLSNEHDATPQADSLEPRIRL